MSLPLPLIDGIISQELEAILDFCYTGEARVAQERLSAFLALAEQLQVGGSTSGQGVSVPALLAPKKTESRCWESMRKIIVWYKLVPTIMGLPAVHLQNITFISHSVAAPE